MLISPAQICETIHCASFGNGAGDYYVRCLDSVNRTRKEHAMNFLFRFFINVSCAPSHLTSFFYIVYTAGPRGHTPHTSFRLQSFDHGAKLFNKGCICVYSAFLE